MVNTDLTPSNRSTHRLQFRTDEGGSRSCQASTAEPTRLHVPHPHHAAQASGDEPINVGSGRQSLVAANGGGAPLEANKAAPKTLLWVKRSQHKISTVCRDPQQNSGLRDRGPEPGQGHMDDGGGTQPHGVHDSMGLRSPEAPPRGLQRPGQALPERFARRLAIILGPMTPSDNIKVRSSSRASETWRSAEPASPRSTSSLSSCPAASPATWSRRG